MNTIRKIDQIAYGVLLIGALNSVISRVAKLSNEEKNDNNKETSNYGMILFASLLAAASVYSIGRLVGPKTREEKKLQKMADIYDMADQYKKKAKNYGHSANTAMHAGAKRLDEYIDRIKKSYK